MPKEHELDGLSDEEDFLDDEYDEEYVDEDFDEGGGADRKVIKMSAQEYDQQLTARQNSAPQVSQEPAGDAAPTAASAAPAEPVKEEKKKKKLVSPPPRPSRHSAVPLREEANRRPIADQAASCSLPPLPLSWRRRTSSRRLTPPSSHRPQGGGLFGKKKAK